VAAVPGPGLPGFQVSIFEHAQRLHAGHPDAPLPADGNPFPDDPPHRRQPRRPWPEPASRAGAEAAAVLDEYFARSAAEPSGLEFAFHDLLVPIHWNEHVAAAAWRADEGLLSHRFGPLAARALRRRGATGALLWLGDRVAGWGRVYVVEELCGYDPWGSRSWLLRRACDGDLLNGYLAGKVASAAHLHEAIIRDDADDELIDHTGLLLQAMAHCAGMGMTLATYPPARAVIAAHARHLGRQQPTFSRWAATAVLAGYLTGATDEDYVDRNVGFSAEERQHMVGEYASVLNRPDWTAVAEAHLKEGDDNSEWIAYATRLVPLNAFTDPPGGQ